MELERMELDFWLRIDDGRDKFDFIRAILLMARLKAHDNPRIPPVFTSAYRGHYYVGLNSVVTLFTFAEDLLSYGIKPEILDRQPELLIVEVEPAEVRSGIEAMVEKAFAAPPPIRLVYRWV